MYQGIHPEKLRHIFKTEGKFEKVDDNIIEMKILRESWIPH